jgi:hypothetical protein
MRIDPEDTSMRPIALLMLAGLSACATPQVQTRATPALICPDLPVIPNSTAVDKPFRLIKVVVSGPPAVSEADRISALRQAGAQAVIEAENEEIKSGTGWVVRSTGKAVVWAPAGP